MAEGVVFNNRKSTLTNEAIQGLQNKPNPKKRQIPRENNFRRLGKLRKVRHGRRTGSLDRPSYQGARTLVGFDGRRFTVLKLKMMKSYDALKVLEEYDKNKNFTSWKSINTHKPICTEKGDWDGLRSLPILVKNSNGRIFESLVYSDGLHFDFYTVIDEFEVNNVIEWMNIPI